jgi:hypothetical protein
VATAVKVAVAVAHQVLESAAPEAVKAAKVIIVVVAEIEKQGLAVQADVTADLGVQILAVVVVAQLVGAVSEMVVAATAAQELL